jgi:gamma-glutamyltranspeptidase
LESRLIKGDIMSFKAMTWAASVKTQTPSQKLILLMLSSYDPMTDILNQELLFLIPNFPYLQLSVYRPQSITVDYEILNENGEVVVGKSTLGATAVGIPGTIAGLFEVHRKFGSLPIETLFKPAIELARKGFIITARQQQSFDYYDSLFTAVNGKPLKLFHNRIVGDTLVNTALANTLEIISQNGEKSFYEGEITEKMINFLKITNL